VSGEIVVPGVPVAQPRQRHTRNGHNYIPKSHAIWDYKSRIVKAFEETGADPIPRGTPVRLRVNFWFPRPKSKVWKTKPMPSYPHTSKPDVDNLVKAVADALNGRLFHDDSQIASVKANKSVCSGLSEPTTFIYWEKF